MKIERITIPAEAYEKLKTDFATVDKLLRRSAEKMNIAQITGDFLLPTTIALAFMCQRLFNEMEELKGKGTSHETGTGDVSATA